MSYVHIRFMGFMRFDALNLCTAAPSQLGRQDPRQPQPMHRIGMNS